MRIGIVNDRKIAVEALKRAVLSNRAHQIAWVAYNGAEAVEHCQKDKPELILMDLIMPVMNGVEATRKIMTSSPCPILVVTADVDTNSNLVFEAISAGALDAVNTPVLGATGTNGNDLLKKIDQVGGLIRESGTPTDRLQAIRPKLI